MNRVKHSTLSSLGFFQRKYLAIVAWVTRICLYQAVIEISEYLLPLYRIEFDLSINKF